MVRNTEIPRWQKKLGYSERAEVAPSAPVRWGLHRHRLMAGRVAERVEVGHAVAIGDKYMDGYAVARVLGVEMDDE
ncbi:hypothetical protein A8926_3724 [Saccharopolyspora spinosa]|uniref:Uncharacterized protein n=1 Tax=Saccharopolyspora spinosa TaxID=60894 RepID=A0A2N3XZ59_SACSN|nr:hypothetical protein A8926_3724 [Saccharopolyspora spinosa]